MIQIGFVSAVAEGDAFRGAVNGRQRRTIRGQLQQMGRHYMPADRQP